MLELLRHKNPILRDIAKAYLMETTQLLFRVLDPFFIDLIRAQSESKVTQRASNLYIYSEPLDFEKVLRLLHLLAAVIETLKDIFVTYIC